jgi:ATP-dependent Clp protease ATP-binding subunit ClpC
VKRTFNPEFINRIDEIIVFEALTDDDLRRIMALLVTQLNDNLVDRKLRIALTPEVVDWIIEATCKDRSYGARPLRRAIQRLIEDPLADFVLGRELTEGSTILVDRREDPGPDETKVDIKVIEGPPVPAVVGGPDAEPPADEEPSSESALP